MSAISFQLFHSFLSTPSARRATGLQGHPQDGHENFYPRPPRGGRRRPQEPPSSLREFLSTPSARRATCRRRACMPCTGNFYPRPPRGGRPADAPGWPVEGRDFYPRPPRGGRPLLVGIPPTVRVISIHALREEGDRHLRRQEAVLRNFYPRPPRGGRPQSWKRCSSTTRFLSTPSARRATVQRDLIFCRVCISIHALREEGDRSAIKFSWGISHFYPRPPRGGRRLTHSDLPRWVQFLSTPSARRATFFAALRALIRANFYPRPPRGGRRRHLGDSQDRHQISIHALREEGDGGHE